MLGNKKKNKIIIKYLFLGIIYLPEMLTSNALVVRSCGMPPIVARFQVVFKCVYK